MKKIALLLLVSALSVMTLASCASDNGGTTTDGKTSTPAATTSGAQTTEEPATTTAEPATTTADPATTTAEPATTTTESATTTEQNEGNDPETAEKAFITVWEDNNGDDVFYEITTNEDGTVTVDYTKEDYASAEARYGYAGASWVNMKADISEIYNGQTKLVLKIKGESGKSLLIKPFDDQYFEKTLDFDGNEQTIELDITEPYDDADLVIIFFGDGGATDVSGTFTIIEAYLE